MCVFLCWGLDGPDGRFDRWDGDGRSTNRVTPWSPTPTNTHHQHTQGRVRRRGGEKSGPRPVEVGSATADLGAAREAGPRGPAKACVSSDVRVYVCVVCMDLTCTHILMHTYIYVYLRTVPTLRVRPRRRSGWPRSLNSRTLKSSSATLTRRSPW